jgi:hypothetical protein
MGALGSGGGSKDEHVEVEEEPPERGGINGECIHVVSRLDMYRTKVLRYRTMVLMARLTKVRR